MAVKFCFVNNALLDFEMFEQSISKQETARKVGNYTIIKIDELNVSHHLSGFVKYDIEEVQGVIDSIENNEFFQSKVTDTPFDPDTHGVAFSPKYAPDGWYQQLFEIEFETSKKDSVHEKDWRNNDIGFTVLKFYDENENELTTQEDIDNGCVRTDVEWMPNVDYMIKGGQIGQIITPTENIYAWTQGVILPDFTGVEPTTFSEGGINMRFVGPQQKVGLDGVAGTVLYYENKKLGLPPGFGTNKIRFVFRHPVGHKHRFQCIFDIFRGE